MAKRKPRIVLYGLGQYGQHMVRFAKDKSWPIVAAYNRAGAKVGQDIGRLAGFDEDYGVVVEDCDSADYGQLDADIALVTTATNRLALNLPAYRRLLGAGMNVICHSGDAYFPQVSAPEIAAEIDALAMRNKVTFLGTGVWDMSRIWAALLVTGPCARITSLFNRSVTDTSSFGTPIMLALGAGMSVAEFGEKVSKKGGENSSAYLVAPPLVLHGLGYTLEHCEDHIEPVIFDKPYYCAALGRELPAGSCAGMRSVVRAVAKEGVTITAHIETRLLFEGEVEHTMWKVEGTPISPKITIERDNGSYMSAMSVFNRIRDVIKAPPGLKLLTDLGPMKHLAIQ